MQVCWAVDEVMAGRAPSAFCCVRPPGHHAEPDKAMGFCFYNNCGEYILSGKEEYMTNQPYHLSATERPPREGRAP